MKGSMRNLLPTAILLILTAHPAAAQLAHHPFAVGASEGAVGHQNALGAWLLGMESHFYLQLTQAVRLTKESATGFVTLVGLSFAYGVFHAAGPGHGKAVLTSYMVSNEVALRRGLVIALAAAILQALVATAVVGIAALVFNATAPTMTAASQAIELTSYVGIIVLGLALTWRKGRALAAALPRRRRAPPADLTPAFAGLAFAPAGAALRSSAAEMSWSSARGRFMADDGAATHIHDAGCDCGHMPDPVLLADSRFDWRAAAIAIVAAGARPCSGAILVLVFALAQGVLSAGIAAAFAMALGTAITTGALATLAVLAKDTAQKVAGAGSPRAALVGRVLELGAALAVLGLGLALLLAALGGVHASA